MIAFAAFIFLASHSPTQAEVLLFSNKWSVAGGSAFYVPTSGNNPRGAAINKSTGNVLLCDTANGSNTVRVLSGVDGTFLGSFYAVNAIQSASAFNHLIKVGTAEDGVVYGCSGAVNASTDLRIYRWSAEDVTGAVLPTLAASNVPFAMRLGDSFAVRGAGTNTQILVGGQSQAAPGYVALFTTTNGVDFSPTILTNPIPPVGTFPFGRMVAFDGTNNAFFGSGANSGLTTTYYKIGFNPTTGVATSLSTNTLPVGTTSGTFGKTNTIPFVVGIQDNGGAPGTHNLRAFDLTDPLSPVAIVGGNVAFPAPATQDGNITGATDIGAGMVMGFNTHNGIVALTMHVLPALPPGISTQPQNVNAIETSTANFNVTVSGSQPLAYQWYSIIGGSTNALATGTNASLTIPNVAPANAGLYFVVVTNAGGSITSTNGALTVIPAKFSNVEQPIWSLSATNLILNTDYNTRGLAFNAPSNHLLLVRATNGLAGSEQVHVLNANDGSLLHSLDMLNVGIGFAGGARGVNVVGVADDGAVYVCNLTPQDGSSFAIYRWQDDSPTSSGSPAYFGNPGVGRIGDSIAVRGSGTGTQILCGSGTNNVAVLFTTVDGLNFTPTVITGIVPAPPNGFSQLGIAFGSGDTFWAKSIGYSLRRISFDIINNIHAVLNIYTGIGNFVGIANDTENQLLAAVAVETPDNLGLFDVSDLTAGPQLLDRDFLISDNANVSANTAVAMDVKGGRVFAMSANNGILATKYAGRVTVTTSGANQIVTWPTTASVLQSSTNVTGTYVDVPAATSPYTNNSGGTLFFRLRR